MLTHVDTRQPETPTEDLAQLLRRVMADKSLTQTEVARRVGVSVSAVSTWVNRIRGTGRGPTRDTLERLADAIGEPRRTVIAAAGRKVPGPLPEDAKERLLALFGELTEEQQRAKLVEMQALAQHNRSSGS